MAADFESRKLAYLNAMSRPDCDMDALNEQFPDVARELNEAGKPAPKPTTFAAAAGARASLSDVVSHFGSLAIILAAIPNLSTEDRETAFEAIAVDPADWDAYMAERFADKPDATLAGGVVGGPSAPAALSTVAPAVASVGPGGLPVGWEKLQWKLKLKLANDLGAGASSLAEAELFLKARVEADQAT